MSTVPVGQKSWSPTKAVLQCNGGEIGPDEVRHDWNSNAAARTKWSAWLKMSACPVPNSAGSRALVLTRPIFCCEEWQRLTSTETRCRGPNLERSKTFSAFAQCVTIIAAAGETLRVIPVIRHGRIIARTPRRSWR